jgi:hypothetical protein
MHAKPKNDKTSSRKKKSPSAEHPLHDPALDDVVA